MNSPIFNDWLALDMLARDAASKRHTRMQQLRLVALPVCIAVFVIAVLLIKGNI